MAFHASDQLLPYMFLSSFSCMLICLCFVQVCSSSDYETWTPPGNGGCLLGQKMTLQRRKPSASCFNDKAWARAGATYEACECEHVRATPQLHLPILLTAAHACPPASSIILQAMPVVDGAVQQLLQLCPRWWVPIALSMTASWSKLEQTLNMEWSKKQRIHMATDQQSAKRFL